MFSSSSQDPAETLQRIEVGIDRRGPGGRLKICLQNHNESLGWYTAGCLNIPLHQVPLLEQALERLRNHQAAEALSENKIIPFESIRAGATIQECGPCDACPLRSEEGAHASEGMTAAD